MTEPRDRRRENALLLAACRDAPHTDETVTGLDWHYLLAAAQRQGIMPIVHEWLAARRPPVSPEATQMFHGAYWMNHFRTRTLLNELATVRAAAIGAGIPLLPLKGAALAPTVYPAPELRPMSDLDLLAHPDDLPRMQTLLTDHGYTPEPRGPSLLPARLHDPLRQEWKFDAARSGFSVLIEVRAEPLDPGLQPLTELDTALTARLYAHTQRMWARATANDAGALSAAPEDMLLHVASHITTRHADFRLIWLMDLRQIIAHAPAFDWDYLAHEAQTLGLAVPVHAALIAAAHWLAAPVPATWRGGAAPLAPRLHLVDRIEWTALRSQERTLAVADLSAIPPSPAWLAAASIARVSWRARVRALRWLLLPSRAYLARWCNAPTDTTGPWYPGAAVFRLVVTFLAGLAALARYLRLPFLPALGERLMRRVNPFGEYVGRN